MKRNLFCIIVAFMFSHLAMGQLAMGEWQTHFSYDNVNTIAQSPNRVYAVSNGALFSVDKQDGSLEFYSKLSGLNDASVSDVVYSSDNDCLIIIYENSNIDIMRSGGITNVPDLYNKQLGTSKAINDVFVYADLAYLSCDFGLMVVNLAKNEVAETCYIGENAAQVKVLNAVVYHDSIYAVTENALYAAAVSDPNIVNYEYWNVTRSDNLPGDGVIEQIHSFENDLLLLRNGKVYRKSLNGNVWENVLNDVDILSLHASNGVLMGMTASSVLRISQDYTYDVIPLANPHDAVLDDVRNMIWIAGDALGVVSYNNSDQTISYYKPSGPAVNIPYRMTFSNGRLFVLQGGRWAVQYNRLGVVMIYENGKWNNILHTEFPLLPTGSYPKDFMSVIVDPLDNKHFYVTSYGMGLYEFVNDELYEHYTFENSTISTIYPNGNLSQKYHYMRMDGGVIDEDGNLWVTSTSVINGLNMMDQQKNWTSITYGNTLKLTTLGLILIPQPTSRHKWILSHRGTPGIVFYDDNNTPYDNSDDFASMISSFTDQDNNTLTPSEYYSIAVDKDGAVWVGTDIGPLVFSDAEASFNSNQCTRIKIPRNDGTNLADFLLENEKINAIAIDGANRKWIGTESSGLYLMSENGQETIEHFTTQNSPLLSNQILSLAINSTTGEVFVGTGAGLLSYQSDAAEGNENITKISAYPNPVREDFNGVVTITGLVDGSIVKITDISGNLVCETRSNGSLATWDCKNKWGHKVSTGIYLAICVSEDGSEYGKTKILVIE